MQICSETHSVSLHPEKPDLFMLSAAQPPHCMELVELLTHLCEHLSGFQHFAITNNAAVNKLVHVRLYCCRCILVNYKIKISGTKGRMHI